MDEPKQIKVLLPGHLANLGAADFILTMTKVFEVCSTVVLGQLHAIIAETFRKWSEKTFGTPEQRGPRGPLLHLEKEAREAVSAIGTNVLAEELADCQILIWDAARRAGLGPVELLAAVRAKLEKNMARQWPMPTSDRPVEHIREGGK